MFVYAYVCSYVYVITHHFLIDRNKLVSCQEKGSGQSCLWMGRHLQKLPTRAMVVWPNPLFSPMTGLVGDFQGFG